MSSSSQPNLLNVLGKAPPPVEPLLGAQDALDRTKGVGDFYEHLWPLEALSEKYETKLDIHDIHKSAGLTTEQAAKLIEEFGPNVLTPPPKIPLWLLFLLQFTNLLMVLLLITGLLTFILYAINPSNPTNLELGVLLYIVVFLTCYETFQQEAKSDQLMEKFRALVPEAASVIRDGINKPVAASELVPGDVIRLKSGDKIPADGLLLFGNDIICNESAITGESDEKKKINKPCSQGKKI